MVMQKKILLVLLAVLMFFIFAGLTDALEPIPDWNSNCINSTHLFKTFDLSFNNTVYGFNQTVICQFGCDTSKNICWKWPENAMPGEYYMLFQITAIMMLIVMLYRIDIRKEEIKIFDLILPIISMILFFSLALQGGNVIDMSTGEAVQLIFVIWFDYGMGTFSLIPFFMSLFKYIYSEVG